MHAAREAAEHVGGALGARRGGAADDARRVLLRVRDVARVDPLGAERDVDVLADGEAALGQRACEQIGGRADVARRRQDQRLAGARMLDGRLARPAQRAQVGAVVLVHRRGDADQHDVGEHERAGVVGHPQRARLERVAQALVVTLDEVDRAGANAAQAHAARVDPDDGQAGGRGGECGRQADVAEAEDREPRLAGRSWAAAARPAAECEFEQVRAASWRGPRRG